MLRIIVITAEGEDLVVRDPETEKTSRISWSKLSNTASGLKYRSECISALLRLVDATTKERSYNVSSEADALIRKATDAARLLY